MRFFKSHVYLLLVLFILPTYLYKIGNDSFWRDEAFIINLSSRSLSDIIKISGLETYPFLYPTFLHFYFKIFPLSEFWARLPSIVFMILAIFIIFFIICNIFKDRVSRLMSLALVIFNPVLFWYAREARAYAMLFLLSFTSLGLSILLKRKRHESRKYLYVLLVLSTLFGLYTHNVFILIALANLAVSLHSDIISLFLKLPKFKDFMKIFRLTLLKKRYLMLSYLIVFLFYLPWLSILNKQVNYVEEHQFWFEFHPFHDLKTNLLKVYIFEPSSFNLDTLSTVSLYFSFWICILALVSNFYMLLSNKIKNDWYRNVSIWFWVLVFLFFVYSFKVPIFYIRYMIFLIPIILIMSVYQLKRSNFKGVWFWVLFLPLFTSLYSTFGYLRFSGENKADMKTLDKDVCVSGSDQGSVLFLHSRAYTYHAFSLYCNNLSSFIYTPKDELPFYEGTAILNDRDFFDGDLLGYDKVLNIYLLNKRSAELGYRLRSLGFDLSSRKAYAGGLFVEEWEKI